MSTTPVNVQIPNDAQAPVLADFVEHALRAAYIERNHLGKVPADDWNQPGIYVLLTDDGSGHVYVGQARRLRGRLLQHNTNPKLNWQRAIAFKRDTTNGFNTAEIGYLEGRVSAEIAALTGTTVIEGQKSGDETLPAHMMISLDAFVKSILAALRLSGISTVRTDSEAEAADQAADEAIDSHETDKTITRQRRGATISDLVSSGLIPAGQDLYLKQGDVEATGTVTADGEIIVNGVAHSSPSRAAANALNLQSSNGWTTWRIGGPQGSILDDARRKWRAQQEDNTP